MTRALTASEIKQLRDPVGVQNIIDTGTAMTQDRMGVNQQEARNRYLKTTEGSTLFHRFTELKAASESRPDAKQGRGEPQTREDVVAEVVRLTEQYREEHPSLAYDEAEVHIWRSRPDLYRLYEKLPAVLPTESDEDPEFIRANESSSPEEQQIIAAIEQKTGEIRQQQPSLSMAEAESGAWRQSPDLYDQYDRLQRRKQST